MKYYYILNDIISSNNDLPAGPRIKCQNSRSILRKYKNGDGPYASLKELRKNSSIYKKLLRDNPKRAQKICQKNFIFHLIESVPILNSTEKTIGNAAFEMLSHIVLGKIKNKNVSGAHLFTPEICKVIKITKPKNEKGVWEAQISIKDPDTDRWVDKKLLTTFFPNLWSKELLLVKLEIAFVARKKISDVKYVGDTDCGIPIVFIYKKDKIVSAYPIYE